MDSKKGVKYSSPKHSTPVYQESIFSPGLFLGLILLAFFGFGSVFLATKLQEPLNTVFAQATKTLEDNPRALAMMAGRHSRNSVVVLVETNTYQNAKPVQVGCVFYQDGDSHPVAHTTEMLRNGESTKKLRTLFPIFSPSPLSCDIFTKVGALGLENAVKTGYWTTNPFAKKP